MSAFTYEHVSVSLDDRIATVAFNRPQKKNALSPRMNDEMVDVLNRLEHDPETDILVLTGSGDSFSSGMDIDEYFRATERDPALSEKTKWTMRHWSYTQLRSFPKVTIAVVNGWCFGGAFMPLISCDLAIAAEEARFGLSEVNWGIIPGGLVTRDVALVLGYRTAMYYILTGETFDGRRAKDIGLVNDAVPRSDLDDSVHSLTTRLRALNPQVLRSSKEAFRHSVTMDYDQAADYLAAKSAQLSIRDRERGYRRGMHQFLDTKLIKPGLTPYERPPETS